MTVASRMNCAALTPSRVASRSSSFQRSSLKRTVVARIGMAVSLLQPVADAQSVRLTAPPFSYEPVSKPVSPMDTFASMNSTLRIDVSTDGDIATLEISGELDEAACPALGDCLARHRRP